MKPSARRRVEREIRGLMEGDGDDCSLCRKPFPHNSKTYGGVTPGGVTALVADCCLGKLKAVVLAGIYVNRHTDVMTTLQKPASQAATLSPHQIVGAIDALQKVFTTVDETGSKLARQAGVAANAANVSLAPNAWKTDDATWFAEHPERSHRLRPLIEGEAAQFLAKLKDFRIPEGHEFQVLIRQVRPGARLRMPFCRNMSVPIPDVEEALHALFDVVAQRQDTGGVISVADVHALATKYMDTRKT